MAELMNCLKDFVGIRGYHVAPASGQFINQLQGISLKSIQHIADSELVTFVAVWDDVQERAWARLRSDFLIAMRAKYCTPSTLDTDAIICTEKILFTRAWVFVLAAELMLERLYSERINKLTTIDRDRGVELHATFSAQYDEAMAAIMEAIRYKETELTLEKTFNRVERLP